jgi:short-subunit dehydrogenase
MSIPVASPGEYAVVTGASSGIGAELARGLARRGHDLVLVARRRERLEALAAELRQGADVQVIVQPCDLSDRGQRQDLLRVLGDLEVTVLCNNAGLGTFGEIADADPRVELEEIEVDVVALAELTYAVVPRMVRAGRGAVLMVGSIAGFQPLPGNVTYAATKAFVNSFSQGLAGELAGTGVTCTLLAPGPVTTEFNHVAGLGGSDARIATVSITAEAAARRALRGLERGRRIVVPGSVAKAAAVSGKVTPRSVLLPVVRRGVARLQASGA